MLHGFPLFFIKTSNIGIFLHDKRLVVIKMYCILCFLDIFMIMVFFYHDEALIAVKNYYKNQFLCFFKVVCQQGQPAGDECHSSYGNDIAQGRAGQRHQI